MVYLYPYTKNAPFPAFAKGMGMVRARKCDGVPRIALGDLEDGTHGQPDPQVRQSADEGFAQKKEPFRLKNDS
jgi:hypothetical protein